MVGFPREYDDIEENGPLTLVSFWSEYLQIYKHRNLEWIKFVDSSYKELENLKNFVIEKL